MPSIYLAFGLESNDICSRINKFCPLDMRVDIARSLDSWEFHRFLHDLTFLPGHGRAGLGTRPHLSHDYARN